MGAASVSICRPLAATLARSAFRAAQSTGFTVSLVHEARADPALGFHGRQGGVGLAALRRFLDRAVNLPKTPVEAGDGVGRHPRSGPPPKMQPPSSLRLRGSLLTSIMAMNVRGPDGSQLIPANSRARRSACGASLRLLDVISTIDSA